MIRFLTKCALLSTVALLPSACKPLSKTFTSSGSKASAKEDVSIVGAEINQGLGLAALSIDTIKKKVVCDGYQTAEFTEATMPLSGKRTHCLLQILSFRSQNATYAVSSDANFAVGSYLEYQAANGGFGLFSFPVKKSPIKLKVTTQLPPTLPTVDQATHMALFEYATLEQSNVNLELGTSVSNGGSLIQQQPAPDLKLTRASFFDLDLNKIGLRIRFACASILKNNKCADMDLAAIDIAVGLDNVKVKNSDTLGAFMTAKAANILSRRNFGDEIEVTIDYEKLGFPYDAQKIPAILAVAKRNTGISIRYFNIQKTNSPVGVSAACALAEVAYPSSQVPLIGAGYTYKFMDQITTTEQLVPLCTNAVMLAMLADYCKVNTGATQIYPTALVFSAENNWHEATMVLTNVKSPLACSDLAAP